MQPMCSIKPLFFRNYAMSKPDTTTNSIFGWKGVAIAVVFTIVFLGIFYLAMHNEPDYMPSKQRGNAHMQHSADHPSAAEMQMSSAEHAAHQFSSADSAQHGH
jgi:hypothetical protein